MTYTDKAKEWLGEPKTEDDVYANARTLAFARFLDEMEEAELKAMVQPVHREPRKEDKPRHEFIDHSYWGQPKPEPVEELQIPHGSQLGQMVGDVIRKLNEVIRRLNTLTK